MEVIVFRINFEKVSSQHLCGKIAAFDFDWTLVKPKEGRTFPTDKNDWQWLRSGVPKKIKNYCDEGYNIVVFTTQTKKWKLELIKEALETLQVPVTVVVAFGKDNPCRKPNKDLFFKVVSDFDKETSFYVGDACDEQAWSSEDRDFAKNIGIKFFVPEMMFPIIYTKKTQYTYYKTDREIVVMVGYPASGKTTFVKNNLEPYGYIRLDGDKLKSVDRMIHEARKIVNSNNEQSIVFDATNGTKENRQKVITFAQEQKLPVRTIVMNTPMEDAMEYNKKRASECGAKKIPNIAYYTFRKRYEEPNSEEKVTVIFV
jgi:bifunctional polynucleotide phosphatase/kinase